MIIKITIEYGNENKNKKKIEMNTDKAKQLYDELNKIFNVENENFKKRLFRKTDW